MNIIPTSLKGLLIIEPNVFEDKRGYFFETHHQERFFSTGLDINFVQDNLSFSKKGTLRGLHFQINHPQAKLVQAVTGEIFDVAVDIRPESPTFGKWSGTLLSEENKRQLFIPEGFAHGFAYSAKAPMLLTSVPTITAPRRKAESCGRIRLLPLTGRLKIRRFPIRINYFRF